MFFHKHMLKTLIFEKILHNMLFNFLITHSLCQNNHSLKNLSKQLSKQNDVLRSGQGRPPCRVLKNPDQRKTNLSEKSALVNLLLCDFWIWFGF